MAADAVPFIGGNRPIPGREKAALVGVIVVLAGMLCFAGAARAQASYEVLHSFDGVNGAFPFAALIQGRDGNFYGLTLSNVSGRGSVFKFTPTGTFTTLHTFECSPADGCYSYAPLMQASDGNLYGTTVEGGAFNGGTVFKLTPTGAFTTLHSFACSPSEGCWPYAGLIQASDGNFYGTTFRGGAADHGTVFKLTPAGDFTTVYSFTCGSDGCHPFAGLVQASDGDLYGTTSGGGTYLPSAVFKITLTGTLTALHSFDCATEGCSPYAGVTQGADGNFYGTTRAGGVAGGGAVFKLTPTGTFTTLHAFDCAADGCSPWAGPIQARRFIQRLGSFYSTTPVGGVAGGGAVFRLTPTGAFSTVWSFTSGSSEGFNPYGGLIQASDGKLYGTTTYGGSAGAGVIFRIAP